MHQIHDCLLAVGVMVGVCMMVVESHPWHDCEHGPWWGRGHGRRGWGHGYRRYGYIYMLNDIHYDPTYFSTQESCNTNIPSSQLGAFGDVECDPPWEFVQATVQGLQDIDHEPDMIFWLGDSPHHPKAETPLNRARVADAVRNCTELIADAFPNTELFPLMGNHDYFPTNQLPGQENEIYNETAELWMEWLNEQSKQTFRKGSYYSQLSSTNPRLRVIALNTNLYLTYNFAEHDNPDDPADQIAWARQQLNKARRCGEKVQLVTHVPVGTLETDAGVHWLNEAGNQALNQLFRDYGDVIVGLHGGHEHMDAFRIIYNGDSPSAVLLVAPSVTPWRARVTPTIIKQARNPALRVIKYDTRTLRMVDIEQYYVNLTRANLEGSVEWELEYTFSDDYGLREVTAGSMDRLFQKMKDPLPESLEEDHVFNRYYYYNTVKVDHPESVPEVCDSICKKGHICSIRYVDYDEYDICLAVYNN